MQVRLCKVMHEREQDMVLEVDFLALVASHVTHGSKVQRYLFVEEDTRADLMHEVLNAFWTLKLVEKLQIPQHKVRRP